MDARAIEKLIHGQSGLLGVSGVSATCARCSAPRPARASCASILRLPIGRELGALAAALGGLDALVFTAGIGEHAAPIRERICRQAAWLGVELDAAANAAGGPRISTRSSRVAAWVIPTNEELMIARHTRDLLGQRPKPGKQRRRERFRSPERLWSKKLPGAFKRCCIERNRDAAFFVLERQRFDPRRGRAIYPYPSLRSLLGVEGF